MTSVETWIQLGLSGAAAQRFAACLADQRLAPADRWQVATTLLAPSHPDELHTRLHEAAFAGHEKPWPAWLPDREARRQSNLGRFMRSRGHENYEALHDWSVQHREQFWRDAIDCLAVKFAKPPREVMHGATDVEQVTWLDGAELNVVETCLRGADDDLALVAGRSNQDGSLSLARWSVGELRQLVGRIANGLRQLGVEPGDRIALDLPMRVEAVAAYLGALSLGCSVVTIADSFSAEEIGVRLEIAQPRLILTQDFIVRGEKRLPLYQRVLGAQAPPAVVLSGVSDTGPDLKRQEDLAWEAFLAEDSELTCVPRPAADYHTILFSSGTTGRPKAIPWDAATFMKAATDAYFHHDTRPGDVLCWPSNLGWMMGPWLVFGSLVNRAAMAIYDGAPTDRGFAQFVEQAGVTMLGLVPSLVAAWRRERLLEHVDWTGLRVLSSTGECSNCDDMFWLMGQAGYKPMIEYCGGTEIGGGYITGTVVQPSIPGHFSTPALGIDLVILDENNLPAEEGEVLLVPPSMGLSRTLLNGDHHAVYYADTPSVLGLGKLRRHGDRMSRVGKGVYRAQGRADDSMNLGGIKVSSLQIEEVAQAAIGSLVSEVAAIAAPPPGGGPARLVLYVVPQSNDADLDVAAALASVQQAIRSRVNPLFKVHDVVPIQTLPRTASNKVMRRKLRDEYQQLTSADRRMEKRFRH